MNITYKFRIDYYKAIIFMNMAFSEEAIPVWILEKSRKFSLIENTKFWSVGGQNAETTGSFLNVAFWGLIPEGVAGDSFSRGVSST